MACCRSRLAPILGFAGLFAMGLGGYNVLTTGCPLGLCRADRVATDAPPPAAPPLPAAADVNAPPVAPPVAPPAAPAQSPADANHPATQPDLR